MTPLEEAAYRALGDSGELTARVVGALWWERGEGLEQIESLEQLRALWHGYRIAVHLAHQAPGGGVDTPEDLARVRAIFAGRSGRALRGRGCASTGRTMSRTCVAWRP